MTKTQRASRTLSRSPSTTSMAQGEGVICMRIFCIFPLLTSRRWFRAARQRLSGTCLLSVADYCSTLLMPRASGVPTRYAACNCSSTLRNSAALPLP